MKPETPMMRQYLEIKSKHPDILLFFRLGDFYEMFFEDAVRASKELEITLTSRNNDRGGKPIPMCGVPHHAVDSYLARLIKKGFKVALCEQVEDARQVKGLVRREVTRVVTPGTTIEADVLEAGSNNFLASLTYSEEVVGLALADLSTGEFLLSQFEGRQAWEQAIETLAQFQPSELVLPEEEQAALHDGLPAELTENLVETSQPGWTFQHDYAERALLDHFQVGTLAGYGVESQRAAIAAAGALLCYLKQTQKSGLEHLCSLKYLERNRHLNLDQTTVNNLELTRGADGNRNWTLLAALDHTSTGMGARLLRQWILRPSLDLEEITRRLDAVEEVLGSPRRLGRLRKELGSIRDIERLLSRVTMETAHPREMLSLKESLQKLPALSRQLTGFQAPLLQPPGDLLEDVCQWLEASIDPQAPVQLTDGGVIRPGYNEELDDLRRTASSGKSTIALLETAERERTGLEKLKVKYNKVFGYFIELPKSQASRAPEHYLRKQTLVNCERFITPELKEHEEKVLGAQERIVELERELFTEVRRQVAGEAARIQETGRLLAVLDVLANFAELAHGRRYVRPFLDPTQQLDIRAGRHPVLELQGDEPFVPNDFFCNTDEDQLLILTGPNMGGKSTFLRQNALIVIMAQMGCFVPAQEARVGLVDRIYTRVGASDNLARGRSTFMVEMIETANILNTATPRSLVLLDEVGRGTATFDGLSLAWSIAEYLTTEPARRARTLFATHYQELTKLENLYPGVKNYCVNVRESGGRILFFHRVMPGVASKSYGIEVARLAGLPNPVLDRARQILQRLERKEIDLSGRKRSSSTHQVLDDLQPALF